MFAALGRGLRRRSSPYGIQPVSCLFPPEITPPQHCAADDDNTDEQREFPWNNFFFDFARQF